MDFEIKAIKIAEHRDIVDELVGELHISEKDFNDKTADWPAIRDHYLQFLQDCQEENDGIFLIAEVNGKAIGFIFGYIDEKDDSNFEIGDADDLYVSEGYVKKEYRKHGIYGALNGALEKAYSNYNLRRVYRYTLYNNHTMQSWLTKQGYMPIRLVYEKWLKP